MEKLILSDSDIDILAYYFKKAALNIISKQEMELQCSKKEDLSKING